MNADIQKQRGTLEGVMCSTIALKATVGYSIGDTVPVYNGDYSITPKTTEQILSTKDKRMVKDVTIKSIPYFETKNEEDGVTVYIGE